MTELRPAELRRSWLFVPGADESALDAAACSGADVLVQELEDFTRPEDRPRARELMQDTVARWRQAGCVTAIRINPLATDGREDLEAAMAAKPDVIALPKVDGPERLIELDELIWGLEWTHSIEQGATEILPNIEMVRGLIQTIEVCNSSRRIKSCLLASEDLAADLGAERGRDGLELAWPRQKFIVDCVAAGVTAVDCPWTFSDDEGLEDEALYARRLGYRCKSAVAASQVATINSVFTPSSSDVAAAARIVDAFDAARVAGESRVELDGSIVEVPYYTNALRLIERASALEEWSR